MSDVPESNDGQSGIEAVVNPPIPYARNAFGIASLIAGLAAAGCLLWASLAASAFACVAAPLGAIGLLLTSKRKDCRIGHACAIVGGALGLLVLIVCLVCLVQSVSAS